MSDTIIRQIEGAEPIAGIEALPGATYARIDAAMRADAGLPLRTERLALLAECAAIDREAARLKQQLNEALSLALSVNEDLAHERQQHQAARELLAGNERLRCQAEGRARKAETLAARRLQALEEAELAARPERAPETETMEWFSGTGDRRRLAEAAEPMIDDLAARVGISPAEWQERRAAVLAGCAARERVSEASADPEPGRFAGVLVSAMSLAVLAVLASWLCWQVSQAMTWPGWGR